MLERDHNDDLPEHVQEIRFSIPDGILECNTDIICSKIFGSSEGLEDTGTECATRSDAWTLVSLSST